MSLVKKAIIPAGGYGTRFLPATKSIPKEMFPLGKKPIVLHVVEELVKSGITDITFVVSHHKQAIESFFASNELMENYYIKKGKLSKVRELRNIVKMAEFTFVYSRPPYGNGGALLPVQHLIKDEPFVLVWSDEMIFTNGKPRVKQCLETYQKYRKPVISAIKIDNAQDRCKYGMAKLKDIKGTKVVKEIVKIIEKPEPGKEPSEYATHGAYVLTPEIFDGFMFVQPDKRGEVWLADLINHMKPKTGLLARIIDGGKYFDCGQPMAYLKSQIDYALDCPEYYDEVFTFITNKVISKCLNKKI